MVKEFQSLFYCHIQNIIDTFPFVFYLKGFPAIPFSMAHLTGDIYIRKEMHLNFQDSVTAAGLAPAALYIKAESALFIASGFCIRSSGKQVPDLVKNSCISCRIRTRGTPDRGLVNIDHLVKLLYAFNTFMFAGNGPGMVQLSSKAFI